VEQKWLELSAYRNSDARCILGQVFRFADSVDVAVAFAKSLGPDTGGTAQTGVAAISCTHSDKFPLWLYGIRCSSLDSYDVSFLYWFINGIHLPIEGWIRHAKQRLLFYMRKTSIAS